MARAQNAYKGRFQKQVIDLGSSTASISSNATGIVLAGAVQLSSKSTATMSGNSTGVVVTGGIKFSNKANAVITGNATGVVTNAGIRLSNKANAYISGNATGVVTAAAIYVAGKKYVNANSTGFIFTAAATKPSARSSAKWAFYTNSTGQNGILVNTTGTTWKYVNLTSALNSTSGY